MYWEDGITLINKAIEKRNEEKDWEMWIAIYPNMDKKTFISFDKFRGKKEVATPSKQKKNLTDKEIIAKAERLSKNHKKKLPPPKSCLG
jgi:hypothetical protein